MFEETITFSLVETTKKVKRIYFDFNLVTDTYTERFDILKKRTFDGVRFNISINVKPRLKSVFIKESSIEKQVLNFIKTKIKEYGLTSKDVMLSGFRVGGMLAMIFGMKYNYHFISIAPHMYDDEQIKNSKIITHIFKLLRFKDIESVIQHGEYTAHGKVIYTHYDLYPFSYSEGIYKKIKEEPRIQLVLVEDFCLAYYIKESSVKILKLCQTEYNHYCQSFSQNIHLDCHRYKFYIGDSIRHRIRRFEDERVYHKIINNTNRSVKYRLREVKQSDVLVVAFSGEVTHESNHDVLPSYNFNQIFKDDFNVLGIRPTFAITGGFSLFDKGDSYPVELVSSLIEQTRKELGITKKNVVLIGSSAGGLACIYYAKKNGYSNVISFSPVMDVEDTILKRPESSLNISKNLSINEQKRLIKEKFAEVYGVLDLKSNIMGRVIYSSRDPQIGCQIPQEFIDNHPQMKFIDVKDSLEKNASHLQIIRKSWFGIGHAELKKYINEMR